MNTNAVLSEAALNFGIGKVLEVTPAIKGLANETYFVNTDVGEFVLRILKTQTPEGLRNEISIEKQLRASGILTVELQQDADKNYYVEVSSSKVTCSKKIIGDHPEITPQFAEKLGSTLAKYSQAITSLPEKTTSLLLKKIASNEIANLPQTPLGLRIKNQFAESLDIFEAGLPMGFIHSDLHTNNLLITPEGEIAVFDFEDTDYNILLLDLATSARSIYWGGKISDDLVLRSLLEGYESVRKLTPMEKKYFNKAVLYSCAAVAAWLYNNSYESYAHDSLNSGEIVLSLSNAIIG